MSEWTLIGRMDSATSAGTVPVYVHIACGMVSTGTDLPEVCPLCEISARVLELERRQVMAL